MTREDVNKELLNIPNKNILAELPTGYGKSKCALDLMKKYNPKGQILIVIPRLVLVCRH